MSDWPELVDALALLTRGARVLEAGTGRGAMLDYLLRLLCARRESKPWRGLPSLVTLDADPAAAASARTRCLSLPADVARSVTIVEADLTEYVASPFPRFDLLVASAFLSAAPLVRPFSLDCVLSAFFAALVPGGRLLIEDYLPLAADNAAASDNCSDAAELARRLWRLDRAVSELAGRPHHHEWPPAWLAGRLEAAGFTSICWVADERQHMRSPEILSELLSSAWPARPESCDPALWLAIDRYRRDLCRRIAEHGLAQWSGSYRLSAVKTV